MSRLTSLSQNALIAFFQPESASSLAMLLTITDYNSGAVLARLTDSYTKRITETTTDVVYGITGGAANADYIFLPMEIALPSEDDNTAPKTSVIMHDVTRYITPIIRALSNPPKVTIELVLTTTPTVVEASFSGFYITNIIYNADTVTAELTMTDYSVEPFPAYNFTPKYFPGLF